MPARIETSPAGKPPAMERPHTDAERGAARTEEQLSDRLDDLEDEIDEAKRTVHENMAEADQPLEDTAGDYEDESSGAQRAG
jgi:hypothetical protein